MHKDIKYMDIKEFREKGYLLELNRRFLHPLGLALEVVIEDDGSEKLGNIWDYREDKEGIIYDESTINTERAKIAAEYIDKELSLRASVRKKLLGDVIQPIKA